MYIFVEEVEVEKAVVMQPGRKSLSSYLWTPPPPALLMKLRINIRKS
jgi:hypothetical protein